MLDIDTDDIRQRRTGNNNLETDPMVDAVGGTVVMNGGMAVKRQAKKNATRFVEVVTERDV